MDMEKKPRTITQNRALHLCFTQLSDLLIEQGIDQRTVTDKLSNYSAPVTPEFLKLVFKTISWTMYRKDSTTQLSTDEMSKCFEVFAKFMGEEFGVEVVWPSNDALAFQSLLDEQS